MMKRDSSNSYNSTGQAQALTPHGEFLGQHLMPGRRFLGVVEHNNYVKRHLQMRWFEDDRTPQHTTAFFGLGRYDWLLEMGRNELAGVLTEADLTSLLNVFGNEIFTPSSIKYLADEVAERFGPDCEDELGCSMRYLVDKVRTLSLLQCCALADVMELITHVTPEPPLRTVGERAKYFGLKLK